jgi:hypothetical protein
MRNPNRTTKGERRFVRQYNPYAARILGVAQAARWYRKGVLLDEARGFDNLVNDIMYGIVPCDLNDRITATLDAQRDALAAAVAARLNGYGAGLDHYKPEPLGPSACGHYEVVEETMSVDALAVPYLSEPRPQVVPESWVTMEGAEEGQWFAKYQAYREGREAGDKMVWHEDEPMVEFPIDEPFAPIDPSLLLGEYQAYRAGLDLGPGYVAWDGGPWRDPNEVAALHAEAIEDALNDDIDPEE